MHGSGAADDRSEKWGWFFRSAIFLGVAIVAAAVVFYLPVFRVESISVEGNRNVSVEDICRIAGVHKGDHIFQVKTDTAAKTLKKDLRIEQAAVRRIFPDGIAIEITERRPVAVVSCEYGFLDLGRNGMILNAYRVRHLRTLPYVNGISVQDLYIGDAVRDPLTLKTLEYLSGLDDEALAQMTEIDVRNPENVVAGTVNAAQIRIGELDRIPEKSALTQDFLEELRRTAYAIEYIDLTYTEPYIKLAKSGGGREFTSQSLRILGDDGQY